MGAIKDAPIDSWDFSYRVNLRGPVLLAKKFLPNMLERNHGDIRLRLLLRCSALYGAIRGFQDRPSRTSQHPLPQKWTAQAFTHLLLGQESPKHQGSPRAAQKWRR